MANGIVIPERLSRPLYGFAEADYLAGVSAGTAKRWLAGYWYLDTRGTTVEQPPVTPEAPQSEAVSFLDLVEIIAIGGLKQSGFSLPRIREIVRNCQQILGVPRPLVSLKLRTDGREIFVDRGDVLLEVGKHKGNQAWTEVLEPFLADLDYAYELAARWWPLGRTKPIVVDPEYGFGFPVIAGSGVRTEIILERFQAGDLQDEIARDFNVDPIEVQRALQFEVNSA